MANVTCPFCGSSMEVDVALTAGQHVVCPYCEKKFTCGEGVAMDDNVTDAQRQTTVNVSCPHCGTDYEVDQSECGGNAICQVCNKEFVIGQMEKSEPVAGNDAELEKGNVKFCGNCGMKMQMDALFCPCCGQKVVGENEPTANVAKVGELKKNAAEKLQKLSSVITRFLPERSAGSSGRLKKLLALIILGLVLDGIALLVSLLDVKEYYALGRMGTFVVMAAFIGIGVWLCVAVAQLKSWARKTYIILTLIGVLLYICGIKSAADGNLLVTVLGFARHLIAIYCVCLCFAKEVVAAFEPDSKLSDTRAVLNTIHCIGYLAATLLLWIVTIAWRFIYHGTPNWAVDCEQAAVAGSSCARADFIEFSH